MQFHYNTPEQIEHEADLFCAMVELIAPGKEIKITQVHDKGILTSIYVWVQGITFSAAWCMRQQAIHMSYARILKDNLPFRLN